MENRRKREILMIVMILVIQTIVYSFVAVGKSYIHMDEAYSLGLANYDKVEIQDNADFYNQWHSSDYYQDYLSVNDDESGNFSAVYENQKNDVHPPLYYFLLRIMLEFHQNSFSKWPGVILNMIIFAFVSVFIYLILKILFKDKDHCDIRAAILTLASALILSSLTNVLYIRMYALLTLNITITAYLHLRLLDKKEKSYLLLALIGVFAVLGSLTHYYYLFYLAMTFVMFVIKYIKEKRFKELAFYVGTFVTAAAISLAIFPYSINHLFFGYRGQGSLSKLTHPSEFIISLGGYLNKFNAHAYNSVLPLLLIGIVASYALKKVRKIESKNEKSKYIKYILYPTLFYTVLVVLSSPYCELRYILPVCQFAFILLICLLEDSIRGLVKEETLNKIIAIVLCVILLVPLIFRIEPEEQFANKKSIVEKLSNELNVPTIYIFNSNNNRFLDDILLFALVDTSYIAKDIECTEENIQEIVKDKDISKGVVIFINERQENDKILDTIKNALTLNNVSWIEGLNACNVYYIN